MQPHNARVRAAPGTGAALFAVLLWAGCAWAQDSSVQKGPTTIDAQSIEGISDVEVRARGSVELRRDETTVFSERLLYNQEFGRIDADGGVRLELGGDRFFGPRLRFDTTNNTGVFESPTYLLQRGQPARGSADRIEFLGKDLLKLTKSTFTTCAPGRPGWMLEMGELELDYEKNEGRVKDAKVRLLDTTILALPFGSFPLEKQRKSGFLTPSYSHTTLRGAEVRAPFYWNIAPEQDATITPVYMSKRGLQLKTQYRYLDPKYVGNLRFEVMPEDQQTGRSRSGFSLLHTHQFSPQWYGRVDLNKVSDDRYFVDLSSQVNQVSTGNLLQDAFLQYSGGLAGFSYYAQGRLQRYQTLQDPKSPIISPYFRLPQFNFGASRQDIAGLADLSVPAEYVRFSHASLVEGTRVSLNPTVTVPLLTPGAFLRPKLGLRHVSYKLDRSTLGTDSPSFSVPWMSLDGGLVFERPVRWFGQSLTQTFEPRLFYVRAPFKDQSKVPLFDTGLSEFNYAQIFTENRFAGGDRFGDANDLTMAVTSRVLGQDGQESFRATLGQRFYFDDERVALNATTPLRTYKHSDLLASVGGRVSKSVSFDATMQQNYRSGHVERYSVAARYASEIAKVISASYRFNRDALRQVDIAGQWPIAPGWYGVGRYNYSFHDRRLLEGLGGVEYNGGCWVFRGMFQRLQAAQGVSSTGIFFQLELNGLGELGTDETLMRIRRSVPGYAVTNPRDQNLIPPGLQPRLPFEQVF